MTAPPLLFGGPPTRLPDFDGSPPEPRMLFQTFGQWVGTVVVNREDVPTEAAALADFEIDTLMPSFWKDYPAGAWKLMNRGQTLEEIWLTNQLFFREPWALLLASEHADQPYQRITRLQIMPADAVLDYLAQRAVDEPSLGVALGGYGHVINFGGVEPGGLARIWDPWPGRSLLCEENNAVGLAALPHPTRERNWLLPQADLARVLAFAHLPLAQAPISLLTSATSAFSIPDPGRGASLDTVWRGVSELLGVRILLVNGDSRPLQASVPYQQSLPAQPFARAARDIGQLSAADASVPVLISDDGRQRWVPLPTGPAGSAQDSWPDLAAVGIAALISPASWARIHRLDYRHDLAGVLAADFATWFHVSVTGRGLRPDGLADVDLSPGAFTESVRLRFVVSPADGRDVIQRATLSVRRRWLAENGLNVFAIDLIKSFLRALVPAPDSAELDALAGAVEDLPFGRAVARLANGPSHLIRSCRAVFETVVGPRQKAHLLLPLTTVAAENHPPGDDPWLHLTIALAELQPGPAIAVEPALPDGPTQLRRHLNCIHRTMAEPCACCAALVSVSAVT